MTAWFHLRIIEWTGLDAVAAIVCVRCFKLALAFIFGAISALFED